MKPRFVAMTRISLALLLALGLGFVTALPSLADEPEQVGFTISPTEAEYHRDEKPDFVKTRISRRSTATRDPIFVVDEEGVELVENEHYRVLDTTLLILGTYLSEKLPAHGDTVVLTIGSGNDDGKEYDSTFTITARQTHAAIDPERASYDVVARGDVRTIIRWWKAEKVLSIVDDDGDILIKDTHYTLEVDEPSTTQLLTILRSYLEKKLQAHNEKMALAIYFDYGERRDFVITAIENPPHVSPDEDEYDLDDRADVTTTVTWGTATPGTVSIVDDADPLSPLVEGEGKDYTVSETVEGKATLTISNDNYLADRLKDIGDRVVLIIAFDIGDPAEFAITAIGTHATIEPQEAIFDVNDPIDLTTTITWRGAREVVGVDDRGVGLGAGNYTVVDDTLTISQAYLGRQLTRWPEELEMTIHFDYGDPRQFVIRAVDEPPSVDLKADYHLYSDRDITAIIRWQHPPTAVESIVNTNEDAWLQNLVRNAHYRVLPNDDGTARLVIHNWQYLRHELKNAGESVGLSIAFNVGETRTLTITAVHHPSVPPGPIYYEWDERPDFVECRINWGSAKEIRRISEVIEHDDGSEESHRVSAEHYMRIGDTLLILNSYLLDSRFGDKDRLIRDLNATLVLRVEFDDGPYAILRIKPLGTPASLFPRSRTYYTDPDDPERDEQPPIETTITWGSATEVVSIVDNDGYHLRPTTIMVDGEVESPDYEVTDVGGGKAVLTIHRNYLDTKAWDWSNPVTLAIGFDVGPTSPFDIRTPCFIATAAYGTPMAGEIQVLREFRDRYLATNRPGQVFVGHYYRVSPPIAVFISEHPGLKPVVRAALAPAVGMSALVVNTTPAEKGAIAGLLLLGSVAIAVWAARRRGKDLWYA